MTILKLNTNTNSNNIN